MAVSTRGVLGSIVMYGMGLGQGIYGYNKRVKEGQNPLVAAASEAAMQIPWFIMSAGAATVLTMLPAVPALTKAATVALNMRYSYARTAATPYSKRFEHTDASYAAMQAGTQAINASRGSLGSEAGMMAKRYMRSR